MRAAFGLLTALPVDFDPDDVRTAWPGVVVVGIVLGAVWLMFGQGLANLLGGGVAAGFVMLGHIALTGGRPLRGLAATAVVLSEPPGDAHRRGLPGLVGAEVAIPAAVVVLMVQMMIRVSAAYGVVFLVPLIARSVQTLLLSEEDTEVGLPAPSVRDRGLIVVATLAACMLAPVGATWIRPIFSGGPVAPGELIVIGIIAFAVTGVVGLAWRSMVRGLLGGMDADGWHATGAVAEVAAMTVVTAAVAISGG